jgi:hypothetical protein
VIVILIYYRHTSIDLILVAMFMKNSTFCVTTPCSPLTVNELYRATFLTPRQKSKPKSTGLLATASCWFKDGLIFPH